MKCILQIDTFSKQILLSSLFVSKNFSGEQLKTTNVNSIIFDIWKRNFFYLLSFYNTIFNQSHYMGIP